MTAQTGPLSGFGPNEWLVQELYESWREDPASVERSWADYFSGITPGEPADGDQRANQPSTEAAVSTSAEQARTHTGPADAAQPAPEDVAPTAGIAGDRAAAQPGPAKTGPATPADSKAQTPTAAPAAPTATKPAPPKPAPAATAAAAGNGATKETTPLRGASARTVANMETSLEVPTATSVRAVPAKLLVDNRIVINNHLARSRGGKVSFTHVIGFALVKALRQMPDMNYSYDEVDSKPVLVKPAHVNLGLAIDMQKKDGTRQLLVPSIKQADTFDFAQFWAAYEDLVRRARSGQLAVDDFAGTTISLTNPGTIGTVHSVPRLMKGQGTIIGVGAMEYPAEFQGAAPRRSPG